MMAGARPTDPQTSHEAAQSVQNIRGTKAMILKLLVNPMTDEQLVQAFVDGTKIFSYPLVSPSGVRSRRAELVKMGLVQVVGFAKTASGRKTILWQVA